ncbi:MAG TPA: endonuclease/exonuclease/phosphatase family protein [Geobacteraceae bacterium]|nr:endonuclease/exonuclease/phosphatase family protein [Geobacteraceae bacterium]
MTTGLKRRLLLLIIFSYGAILAAITAMNRFGADRWWFGALNLYLPQAMWVVPAVLLTFLSLRVARHWIWMSGLCALWVLGPIMGFCWSPQAPPDPAGALSVRIMTCNAKYGYRDIAALIGDIARYGPDVVLLQDAGGSLSSPLGNYFRKWNVRSFGQYVIASKLPLSGEEARWISFPGEKQACLRCRLYIGATAITIYNVHFQSPREGLNAFRTARKRPWYLPEAIQHLENNVEARLTQARAIREFVRQEQGPVIVAGDLNSTDSSQACLTLRDAGLHDAFAEGGRGYGYTYGHFLLQHRLPWLRASWMRIDHIMMNAQLQSWRCRTGTGKASDHRPVIADLIMKLP